MIAILTNDMTSMIEMIIKKELNRMGNKEIQLEIFKTEFFNGLRPSVIVENAQYSIDTENQVETWNLILNWLNYENAEN